jgi:predicted membrane-bound dolichyl-phosphate-mannose-protein mannosyltransferase
MEIVKLIIYRLGKWEYTWVCLLVLVTLVMHFSILNQPAEPFFDEQYYIGDARAILDGHGELRLEHPPLAELIITFGMFLFGDTPLGWRFFSILFGTIGIVFFYLICRQLSMSQKASFLATSLFALENLSFVQASIAMLDVYSVTFMLAAFWFYLKGNYPFAGVFICFSTLAKLSGALVLPIIVVHWLLVRRDRPAHFSASMVLAPLLFFVLIPLFDFTIARQLLLDPLTRIKYILLQSSKVTYAYATHPFASRPWEWLIWPQIMPYWYIPHYTATISFTVWALIIPSVFYMGFLAKKGNTAGLFGILWFASTYLVWLPLSAISDRMSFVYYFYPTVGAICIGIGMGLSRLVDLWRTRRTGKARWAAIIAVSGYLLLHIAVFVILSPVFTQWVKLASHIIPT